ncbi:MAG: MATE family efflux transporter [Clostridiales bacterium]|nr:MATE family efflux transporter [Clostridiales bacterium]
MRDKGRGRAAGTDLTVGKPAKVLWLFCLPLFGSIIFQQLYNIADSLVAGKFIGEYALAAVGNSYELTLIFIAFAFGCNIGCSVIVSQYFGAKDFDSVRTAVSTAMRASGALCAALMLLGFALSGPLLRLTNTPEAIFADSLLYLRIWLLGLPFVFYYNIATGIFSAMGDSRTPFFFLAASSTANIGADILFVTAFGMGVEGVAWATFLCQGVSCALALLVVYRRLGRLGAREGHARFSMPILRRIAAVAVPSILQQSFISVGNVVLQGVINGFGPGVIAGYAAGVKLNNLVITSLTTLGNGVSNYTAQNMGAGRPERVRQGFHAGLRLVWTLCVPITAAYFALGRPLLMLFMDAPAGTAMDTGALYLRILSPFYAVVAAKLVADGVLRGTSRMKPFMISTFTDLILRVVLAAVLSRTSLGSAGIWCAWPIGWVIATCMSVRFVMKDLRDMPESGR